MSGAQPTEEIAKSVSRMPNALLADNSETTRIEPHRRFHEHDMQVRPVLCEVEQSLTDAATALGVETRRHGRADVIEKQQSVICEQLIAQRDIVRGIGIGVIGVEVDDLDLLRQAAAQLGSRGKHLQRRDEVRDAGLADEFDQMLEIRVVRLNGNRAGPIPWP